MNWRVRVQYQNGTRDIITYKAESKHQLRQLILSDNGIVFAETTGGDGNTANDMIVDIR